MHAYLVCSAGLKLKLHICVVAKAFKHLIMCDSRLSIFLIDRHFLAVIGISAYGTLYGALVILYIATDNAHVYTARYSASHRHGHHRLPYCLQER